MHLEWQIEDKTASLVYARRFSHDLATGAFYKLFDNGQSKTNAVVVDFSRALQHAKLLEELGDVLSCDSNPRVLDLYHKVFLLLIVGRSQVNGAAPGKFDRIFDQVDQDLLETRFVPNEIWQHWLLPVLV